MGQCLGAFANCFPVAFLEPEFNSNNRLSVLAKSRDQSVQVQEMLQNLSQHIPQLEKLLLDLEQCAERSVLYSDQPNTFDIDLPLMCSYLTYWWQFGPGNQQQQPGKGSTSQVVPITQVTSTHINRFFCAMLKMIRDHVGMENAPWLCRIHCSLICFLRCT